MTSSKQCTHMCDWGVGQFHPDKYIEGKDWGYIQCKHEAEDGWDCSLKLDHCIHHLTPSEMKVWLQHTDAYIESCKPKKTNGI
jgi:hypothetical protein